MQTAHKKVAWYILFVHACNIDHIFRTIVPYTYISPCVEWFRRVVLTAIIPYDYVDSGKVGDHDGTCNMSIGQLVLEKWSKMFSTSQFSTVLVRKTVLHHASCDCTAATY